MSASDARSQSIVPANELLGRLDDDGWIVIDCRFDLMNPGAGKAAYLAGHIPGARYAHLDDDLAGPVAQDGRGGRHPLPDPDMLSDKLGEWGIGSDSMVVAYDDVGGAIAARLWWLLRWLGHNRVGVLDGGLGAWQSIGGTLNDNLPNVIPTQFTGKPGSMPVITVDEVESGLAAGQIILLDARAADRFNGRVEPIDKKAGHVPGATNAPFNDNLNADKCFLDRTDLGAYYKMLRVDAAERLACMCGSGVTACHTILALEQAGCPAADLYTGSWSDWISDAKRPIERDDASLAVK